MAKSKSNSSNVTMETILNAIKEINGTLSAMQKEIDELKVADKSATTSSSSKKKATSTGSVSKKQTKADKKKLIEDEFEDLDKLGYEVTKTGRGKNVRFVLVQNEFQRDRSHRDKVLGKFEEFDSGLKNKNGEAVLWHKYIFTSEDALNKAVDTVRKNRKAYKLSCLK